MREMRRAVYVVALAVGVATQCTPAGSSATEAELVTGRWGGRHAALTLTDAGGAIEYDCAHGGLRAPLHTDRSGRFDVSGVHVREHGGPMREGEIPDSAAARFSGRVNGDSMTLRVIVGADTLGPFELRRDGAPILVKCL